MSSSPLLQVPYPEVLILPDFWVGHYQLAQACEQRGEHDLALEALAKAAAFGGDNSKVLSLRGFGVFNVRPRKTGIGRNPRTGAEVSITPGKAVRFKPGKELHLLDGE